MEVRPAYVDINGALHGDGLVQEFHLFPRNIVGIIAHISTFVKGISGI